MNIVSRYEFSRLLLLTMLVAVLVLVGFGSRELNANAAACNTVTNINGEYQCSGKCVVTGDDGRELISVSGETDTVNYFEPMSEEFYQVEIVGDENFHEIEIGPLVGAVRQDSTALLAEREGAAGQGEQKGFQFTAAIELGQQTNAAHQFVRLEPAKLGLVGLRLVWKPGPLGAQQVTRGDLATIAASIATRINSSVVLGGPSINFLL